MKKLHAAYKNASYEIRLKTQVNFVIQAVVTLLLLILGAVRLLMNIPLLGFILIGFASLFFVTLVLLFRGKYTQSSYLFSSLLMILLICYTFLSGFTGAGSYSQFACYLIAALLIAAYQVQNSNHLRIFALVGILSYTAYVLWTVLSGAAAAFEESLIDQLDGETLVFLVAVYVIIMEKKTFRSVTEDALAKFEESEVHSNKMISLVSSVSEQIDQTVGLKDSAEETGMAVKLIENRIGNIRKALENLNDGFSSTRDALGAIGSSLGTLKGNAVNQSSHVTQSSAAIEEMVASIKSVSHTIMQKKQSVENLIATSRNGEAIIKDTESSFQTVIEQIGSIRDMTSLISGIAAQTNLLAMNAAIEAAHAGDAGRGFAVVADEIRKLAENSSGNAKKIAENLKIMIESIEDTGMRVKNSGESFQDIRHEVDTVARVMDDIYASTEELNAGSGEILKATSSLNDLSSQVMDSIKEVDRDKSTIDSNLSNNQNLSEEVETIAGEIHKDADEIRLASDKVLSMAASLADQSKALKKEVH